MYRSPGYSEGDLCTGRGIHLKWLYPRGRCRPVLTEGHHFRPETCKGAWPDWLQSDSFLRYRPGQPNPDHIHHSHTLPFFFFLTSLWCLRQLQERSLLKTFEVDVVVEGVVFLHRVPVSSLLRHWDSQLFNGIVSNQVTFVLSSCTGACSPIARGRIVKYSQN